MKWGGGGRKVEQGKVMENVYSYAKTWGSVKTEGNGLLW
jgi:hypothetical protein